MSVHVGGRGPGHTVRSAIRAVVSYIGSALLLSGDMQSGTDRILLSGDMQSGADVLLLEGRS